MTIPADILRLVVTSLVSALIGGAAGYAVAWYRLRRTRLSIIESRRTHRTERLAWHRELYQESTSRIHRPAGPAEVEEGPPDEALEQLRLEMTLLKEDHRIETQLLKEENEELRSAVERSRAAEASFTDLIEDAAPAEEAQVEIVEAAEATGTDELAAEPAEEPSSPEPSVTEDTGEPLPEAQLLVEDEDGNEPEPAAAESGTEDVAETGSGEDAETGLDDSSPEKTAALRRVPEDIRALFLESSIREKLFPKKSTRPEKRPKRSKPADTASRDELPSSRPAFFRDLPGKPMDQDADGFHFHWEAPRAQAQPKPQPAAKTRHVAEPARMDMPAFRSLYDMLQATGVSLSVDPSPESSAPDMDPVHRIVGLDRESYALLVDLGYASLEQLASLSDTETRRLAAVFRISPDRIRDEWTSSAQSSLQANRPGKQDQELT